jgi:hypothetical protein
MRSGRGDGHLRPPGFPIRKSSDHSLVADSPRLIAGSNVLHRLLVPRHPPCALSNLATFLCRCTTDHTRVWSIFRRRCSRPLCSSQDTDGAKPHDHSCDRGSLALTEGPWRSVLRTAPVPSDTQQRAHPAPVTGSPFHPQCPLRHRTY